MKALTVDRKIGYCTALIALAVSILPLLLPASYGLWVGAVVFSLTALGVFTFIRKRCILSYNKTQVLLIVATIAALYLMLFYLSGLKFGFSRSSIGVLSIRSFFKTILPISLIIAGSELSRHFLLAEKSRIIALIAYAIGVLSVLACNGVISSFRSSYEFADFLGMTLFPALTANVFFNYTSTRYGILPNLAYRLILALYVYVIPFIPSTPSIISSFGLMVLPIIALFFIAMLFEMKKKRVKTRSKVAQIMITSALAVVMILTIVLVSCQFRYGIVVIATESMTGEINKGDAVVYESVEHCDEVKENDVIIFVKNDRRVVHRVVDINTIDGQKQYITKGDANEDVDAGFVTDEEIVGVVHFKVIYIGFPSLWLRDAINN